jgi:hypothetical protein
MPCAGQGDRDAGSGAAVSQNPRLAWAIENNVHWYDALCEAHAIPGEHHLAFWLNRHVMPPYMSNLITLRDVADSEVQLAAIRSLRDAGVFGAVKDSFRCLSLTELGLRVLFHATWIFRDASSGAPADAGFEEVHGLTVWVPVES